jgi:hypothetical protein
MLFSYTTTSYLFTRNVLHDLMFFCTLLKKLTAFVCLQIHPLCTPL